MRWLVVPMLMLSACSAALVQNPGKDPLTQPGMVCYNQSGPAPMLRARRADADAQMTQACHGPYTVLNAESSKDGNVVKSSLNEADTFPEDYVYVTFACTNTTATRTAF